MVFTVIEHMRCADDNNNEDFIYLEPIVKIKLNHGKSIARVMRDWPAHLRRLLVNGCCFLSLTLILTALCFDGVKSTSNLTSSAFALQDVYNISQTRVAVCITGAARTLRCPAVYKSIRKYLLDGLGMDGAKIKTFMVLSFDSEAESNISFAIDHLQPEHVQLVSSNVRANVIQCPSFASEKQGSWRQTFFGQFYKLQQCYSLVKEYERDAGFLFTHIVRTRPDNLWQKRIMPISQAEKDCVTVGQQASGHVLERLLDKIKPGTGYCSRAEQFCVPNDHFAIVPRKFADIFMNSATHHAFCGRPEDFFHCHEDPFWHFGQQMYAPPECILSHYLWENRVPLDFDRQKNLSISFKLTRLNANNSITDIHDVVMFERCEADEPGINS